MMIMRLSANWMIAFSDMGKLTLQLKILLEITNS